MHADIALPFQGLHLSRTFSSAASLGYKVSRVAIIPVIILHGIQLTDESVILQDRCKSILKSNYVFSMVGHRGVSRGCPGTARAGRGRCTDHCDRRHGIGLRWDSDGPSRNVSQSSACAGLTASLRAKLYIAIYDVPGPLV